MHAWLTLQRHQVEASTITDEATVTATVGPIANTTNATTTTSSCFHSDMRSHFKYMIVCWLDTLREQVEVSQ